MSEITVTELVLEERDFLHDLSNQLVISQGMANIVLNKMKKIEDMDLTLIDKQEKAVKALNQQVVLLKERRSLLHTRS